MPDTNPNPNPNPNTKKDNLSPPSDKDKSRRRFSFSRSNKADNSLSSQSTDSDHDSSTGEPHSTFTSTPNVTVSTKKKPSFLANALHNIKKGGEGRTGMARVPEEIREKKGDNASSSSDTGSSGLRVTGQPGSSHTTYKTVTSPSAPAKQLPPGSSSPSIPSASSVHTAANTNTTLPTIPPSLTMIPAPVPSITTYSIDTYSHNTSVSQFATSITSARQTVDRLRKVNMVLNGLAVGLKLGAGWLPLIGGGVDTVVSMMNSAVTVEVGKVAALRLVEHSATVLTEVQQSIIDHKSDFSSGMTRNLNTLMANLHESMLLISKLADRPFLKLYFFTQDINSQVSAAETNLEHCTTLFQLQALINIDAWQQQATRDRETDMNILFGMMRHAMEDSDAMMRLINVKSNEQAEAIKTLQRSMETMISMQERHYGEDHSQSQYLFQTQTETHFRSISSPAEINSPQLDWNNPTGNPIIPIRYRSITGRQGESPLPDPSGSWSSASAKWGSMMDQPGVLPVPVREGSRDDDFKEHKGFCEKALDVLRRNSSDVEVPDWTITSLEVTHEVRVSSGFFSEIWQGTWRNHLVALKQLNANADRDIFLREINTWRSLRSQFILPLLGASSATGPPPWFLVSPYMRHGNVLQYLESSEGKQANKIELGMAYLHSRELIHGDFKGANVLITNECRAIICDFGLSQLKAEIVARSGIGAQAEIWSATGGTMRWKSPERLLGAAFSYPADVYAFGITIFEVYNLTIPFGAVDDSVVRKNIIAGARPERPKDISDALWMLEERCWAQEPAGRPGFEVVEKEIGTMIFGRGAERKGSALTCTTDSSEDTFITAEEYRIPSEQQAISPTMHDNLQLPEVADSSSTSGSIRSIPPHLNDEPTNESDVVERIFRHHLEHHYDDRLRLPLWFPTAVNLGSVGYIRHGQFIKLLDAHQPPLGVPSILGDQVRSGTGGMDVDNRLPPRAFMSEFESLQTQVEDVEVRGVALNALDKAAVAWTKFIKGSGQTTEHAISYRKSFAFKPGSTRSAFLVVEEGRSEIYKDNSAAREYLSENMEWILNEFQDEHHIRKEDVIIVVGTLSANKYAMFVSNFAPRATVNFNVHADQHENEPWGTWTIDQKPNSNELARYKVRKENNQPRFVCKVSKIDASPSDAVLLARLRWSSVKQGYDMWD